MNGPSPHLSWDELACEDGTPYPDEWRTTRGKVLGRTFERIRTLLGKKSGKLRPITVASGYRTPEHNASVNGAKDSMHLHGLAMDLHTPAGATHAQLVDSASEVLGDRGGLFIYPWGVHVDRRDYLKRPKGRGDYR